MHLEIRRHTYFDINDKPCFIYGVSIPKVKELEELFKLFWFEISKVDETLEIDFLSVIGINKRVFNLADAIINLCNLDADGIDLQLLAAMVHSYVDDSGIKHRGFIEEIFFKSQEQKEVKDSITWEQYYYQTLTNLANKEGGLDKALEVFNNTPQEIIEGYLHTYYDQVQKQLEADPNNKDAKRERYKKMYDKAFGKNGKHASKTIAELTKE